MTYTCATKGCGETIRWTLLSWSHETDSPSWFRHYAHPVGGTNTTPPNELSGQFYTVQDPYEAGKSTIRDLRDKITALENDLDAANDKADALTAKLEDAEAEIEKMEKGFGVIWEESRKWA